MSLKMTKQKAVTGKGRDQFLNDSDDDLNDRTTGGAGRSFADLARDGADKRGRGIDGRGQRPDDRSRSDNRSNDRGGGYNQNSVQNRDYQANFGRNQDRDRSPNFAYGGQKEHAPPPKNNYGNNPYDNYGGQAPNNYGQQQNNNFGGYTGAPISDGGQQKFMTQSKRLRMFNKCLEENKKMNGDQNIRGYNIERDGSNAYAVKIRGLESVRLPKGSSIDANSADVSSQLHFTFLYKDGHDQFYFGRTCKTRKIKMRRGNDGSFGHNEIDFIFFHTGLDRHEHANNVMIVCESALYVDSRGRYGGGDSGKTVMSGGWALIHLNQLVSQGGKGGSQVTVDFQVGTVRTMMHNDQSSNQREGSKLVLECRNERSLDGIKELIPPNVMVSAEEKIPGIIGDRIPTDPRGSIGKIQLQKQVKLFVHNIQISGSPDIEHEVERMFANMYIYQNQGRRGQSQDLRDVNVFIKDRRLSVRCHNTWREISKESGISLEPADHFGTFYASVSVPLKDFVPHNLVGLIFDLEFRAEVQGHRQASICLGYQVHMPSLNSIGAPDSQDIELKLNKGPGESYNNDLLISEEATFQDANVFDLVLRAHITTNQIAPESTFGPRMPQRPPPVNNNQSPFGGPDPFAIQPQYQPQMNQPFGGGYNQPPPPQYNQQQPYVQNPFDAGFQITQDFDKLKQSQTQALQALQYQIQNTQSGNLDQHMMSMLELQRTQMNQESQALRKYIADCMTEMKNMQDRQRGTYNVHGDGHQDQQPLGGTMRGLHNQEMQQIGNVFYNLLHLLGQKNQDDRMIGLSNDLRDMIQSRKFDNLFEGNVPFAGLSKVNLLKTVDLSVQDQAHLIKSGLGDLLHHPSNRVLSSAIVKEEIDMKKEFSDPKKANRVTIRFVCYKTPMGGPVLRDLPQKFFFQFRFFSFPDIVTEYLKLDTAEHAQGGGVVDAKGGYPYFLKRVSHYNAYREDQRNMRRESDIVQIDFTIDPSESKIKDEHERFARYLRDRYLTVDVFDGTKMFYFGSCKIPLFELLRQGERIVTKAKECEIFNPENSQYNGHLQVVMTNEGSQPAVSEQGQMMSNQGQRFETGKTRRQPTQGDKGVTAHNNKKVVYSKPMEYSEVVQAQSLYDKKGEFADAEQVTDPYGNTTFKSNDFTQTLLHNMNKQQLLATEGNDDLKKRLRVDRIRKYTTGHHAFDFKGTMQTTVADPSQPDWARYRSLREIDQVRQAKKDMIINMVLNEYNYGDNQLVPLFPGEPSFITLQVENRSKYREVYTAQIEDPDIECFIEPEVKLVVASSELKYWTQEGKIKPQEVGTDAFTSTDTVTLEPGQKIDLLFKFLTLRDVAARTNGISTNDTVALRKVKIVLRKNMDLFKTVEVQVMPKNPCLDHTYRFYEPENSYFQVKIPPFLQIANKGLTVKCSKTTITAKLDKTTGAVVVQGKTGSAMQKTTVLVYLFSDNWKTKTEAVIKIEVMPLQCLYSQTKAGVQHALTLPLLANEAKKVEIYSSNKKLVYLPKRNVDNQVKLFPNVINHIQVHTKSFAPKEQKVIVNAIDSENGKLVFSWLLIMSCLPPTPTETHKVQVNINAPGRGQIRYQNPSDMNKTFEISTSRPDLMEAREEMMPFNRNETRTIELLIHPQSQMGTGECYLFINDQDLTLSECFAIEIMYAQR